MNSAGGVSGFPTIRSAQRLMLRGLPAIDLVRHDWPSESPVEFASAEWILSTWEFLPELGSPVVARVADGSGWAAIAMTESHSGTRRRLTLAGAPLVDEYDVVSTGTVDRKAVTRGLVRLLREEADKGTEIQLDCVLPGSVLAEVLAEDEAHWSLESEPAPVLRSSYLPVSAKGHSRRVRLLSRLGPVTFDSLTGEEFSPARGTDFLERRLKSWAARGRIQELPAIERSPAFPRFVGVLTHRMAAQGNARIHRVKVNGRVVAEDLLLGPAHDPLLYLRSYDPAYAASSPGRILLEQTTLGMSATTFQRLRLGRGDEPYKLSIGADDSHVLTALSRS